jgi:hypothetical protein
MGSDLGGRPLHASVVLLRATAHSSALLHTDREGRGLTRIGREDMRIGK